MHDQKWLAALAALIVTTFIGRAEAENVKLAWLSFAPEIGYAFFSKGELDKDYQADIEARNGVVVKGHVDIGGDGLAFELAPTYAWQGCGGLVGNLNAVGGEATLVYRFKGDSIYPGIGIGFHGAYLFANDNIKRGVELMGRVPAGLTWYFVKYIGLVLEGGFLFGGTGIRFKDVGGIQGNLSDKTEFAFNLGFDLLVGLRFP